MYDAKVLADSATLAEDTGVARRLVTLEVTMPRMVLAEFNTHRVFSRNSASSRAIPVVKQLRRVLEDPFIPIEFGTHKAGMQAGPSLEGEKLELATAQWLRARDDAVRSTLALITHPDTVRWSGNGLRRRGVESLLELLEEMAQTKSEPSEDWLAVHKQIANRLLEPFMWHTVIVSSTEWENFFALRCPYGDEVETDFPAQPEIQRTAIEMRKAMRASTAVTLAPGEWHLPLVGTDDYRIARADKYADSLFDASRWLAMVSAGRCARVSFDRQGEYEDPEESRQRAEKLLEYGHMSPFEHPATPDPDATGNFRGWQQFRATIPNEHNLVGVIEGRPGWEKTSD